jgi:serine/threonine protein phosphatase PrpC
MSDQPSLTWSSCALSHVGKVRKVNEDAYLERLDIGLWSVADGMGGHTAGDKASRLVVTNLDAIEPQETLEAYANEARRLLQQANQELVSSRTGDNKISGSTVVALLALGNQCAYLWAGDSRAYLFRDNRLTQLTTDHTEIEFYVQMGLMTREEATNHPASNRITSAIGAGKDLQIDLGTMEIKAGDRYLLCSDGLQKHVPDAEIAETLAAGSNSEAAQKLIALTLSRGATDNVTVIVVDVHEPSQEPPAKFLESDETVQLYRVDVD